MKHQTNVEFVLLSTSGQTLNLSETDGYYRMCRRLVTMGNSNSSNFATLNGIDVELAGGLELNSFPVESLVFKSGAGILCLVVVTPKEFFSN